MARSNNPSDTEAGADNVSPVQPIDSVTNAPVDESNLCWNCLNNNKKRVLDDAGVCSNCGFNIHNLYNGDIEADKISKRLATQQS